MLASAPQKPWPRSLCSLHCVTLTCNDRDTQGCALFVNASPRCVDPLWFTIEYQFRDEGVPATKPMVPCRVLLPLATGPGQEGVSIVTGCDSQRRPWIYAEYLEETHVIALLSS